MSSLALVNLPLVRARNLRAPRSGQDAEQVWTFENMKGRLVELSQNRAAGATSVVTGLILQAQAQGQPVVWVAGTNSIFFPPDMVRAGVNMETLSVVWAPGLRKSLICIEILMRSGAFGLVVGDIGAECRVSDGSLGRLVKLAEVHQSALTFLTIKRAEDQSLGSMISLRATVDRNGAQLSETLIHIVKDKRDKPGAVQRMKLYGPSGMY